MNDSSGASCDNCRADRACELCAAALCERCAVAVGGGQFCRECSAQQRNDYALIEYFSVWHRENAPQSVKFIEGPSEQSTDDGKWEVQVQFEQPDIIGYVTVNSNGHCEASTMNLVPGGRRLYRSAICNDNTELAAFLADAYERAEHINNA